MKTIVYPKTYIVWDLETTGFVAPDSKIVEIGMQVVEDGNVVEEKRWVLNNNCDIPEHITAINGMTREIAEKEGIDPKQALSEFVYYLRQARAHLTHNGVRFDIPFLLNTIADKLTNMTIGEIDAFKHHLYATSLDTAVFYKAKKMGIDRLWSESFKDYADRIMSIKAFGVKYNVSICCDELGIDRSKVTQHRALGDVELTRQIFIKMLSS